MPRRPRSGKKKNHYFTKVHEQAIIDYTGTDDIKIRTDLYINYIRPAFNEMVDKIVYTYKFNNLPNIDVLRDDCKIWLTTILDKYDPSRGSKAFSYFSVITKNWFIHKVKKNAVDLRREVEYDNIPKSIKTEKLVTSNKYDELREQKEFWSNLWEEIHSWESINMKPNEKRVYEAVKIVLSSADDIEIFNKKAVYLYIREITGLNTKQVVNNLNKLREKYRLFKKKWDKGDI